MSVIIRLARPGEERLLAEVHTAAAYNSPNKVSNAFFRPNFKDQLEQYAEFKTLSYARHIKKEQVVCAIVDEKIVGLAAWNLPIKSTTDEVIEVETEAVAKREKDRLGGVDSYRQSISDSECLPRTNKYFPMHLLRNGLMVHPDHQGKGIATQLCKYVERIALQHNLPIGAKAYISSFKLHEKLGYRTLEHLVVVDERPGHLDKVDFYFQEWRASA